MDTAGSRAARADELERHRPYVGYAACLTAGALLGLLLLEGSPSVVAAAIGAVPLLALLVKRPDYGLLLLFGLLVLTTDSPPEDSPGAFAIPDPDIGRGLPQATLTLFLLVGFFFFARRFLLERRRSRVSFKYLIVFALLLGLSAVRGAAAGWERVMIQMDFIKFLLPVLCFYLAVNAFEDRRLRDRMTGLLIATASAKAAVLCLFYFAGRGHLYGDDLIVSLDSADHLLFIMLLLVMGQRALDGRISFQRAVLYALGAAPMLFALVFSFRRGHWVGAVFSAVLWFLLMAVRAKRRAMVAALLAAAVALPVLWAVLSRDRPAEAAEGLSVLGRIRSIFDATQHSNVHHALEAQETLKDILADPIRGLGLGSLHRPVSSPLVDWDESQQPLQVVHNTFLYLWMKMGIGGLLFALWVAGRFIAALAALRRAPDDFRSDGIAWGASAGLWFAMFLTGPVPFYHHQSFLIALATALVVSLRAAGQAAGGLGGAGSPAAGAEGP